VGTKGACGVGREKSAAVLFAGYLAMFRAASSVFVGDVPPGGVACANKASHAVVPVEFTHDARILASVYIFVTGIAAPVGAPVPGEDPCVMSVRLFTLAKAFASPSAFVELVPICPADPKNGANAQTDATVVTSSMFTKEIEDRPPQGPVAAISAIAGLFEPSPGSPPVATRYVAVFGCGHVYSLEVIEKFPF